MKSLNLSAITLLLVLLSGQNASALTTETRGTDNSDGSTKFSDPDEQMPNFVLGPNSSPANNAFTPHESPVTRIMPGDVTPGAQAFDQAFSHVQSQDK